MPSNSRAARARTPPAQSGDGRADHHRQDRRGAADREMVRAQQPRRPREHPRPQTSRPTSGTGAAGSVAAARHGQTRVTIRYSTTYGRGGGGGGSKIWWRRVVSLGAPASGNPQPAHNDGSIV